MNITIFLTYFIRTQSFLLITLNRNIILSGSFSAVFGLGVLPINCLSSRKSVLIPFCLFVCFL